MVTLLVALAALALGVLAFLSIAFYVSCIHERERRASALAAVISGVVVVALIRFLAAALEGFFDTPAGVLTLAAICAVLAIGGFLFVRRTAPNVRALAGTHGRIVGEVNRFDERDQVFARNRTLRPGTKQYDAFYAEHPGWEKPDAERRTVGPIGRPGLIDQPGDEPNVAMTLACQSLTLHLSSPAAVKPGPHVALKAKLEAGKVPISPEEASLRVKAYARALGADLVGIARIDPLWLYSHKGEIFHENWDDWGQPIETGHTYAIVMAEEMLPGMVACAPHTPTVIESMRNYAKGAYLATQVAAFIANLGYSATANHLRHYEALMVPLAVDAGLGESSRMGYLITRELGPRIRLSAVTTDLPLVPDHPVDLGIEDFCQVCKKCARLCPSQSIQRGDQEIHNGTLRWKLDEWTCFVYWAKVGTDCNVCMRVCPWSHPRTLPHRAIMWVVARNARARRVFSAMDDIFYGLKPKPQAPPRWASFGEH